MAASITQGYQARAVEVSALPLRPPDAKVRVLNTDATSSVQKVAKVDKYSVRIDYKNAVTCNVRLGLKKHSQQASS